MNNKISLSNLRNIEQPLISLHDYLEKKDFLCVGSTSSQVVLDTKI